MLLSNLKLNILKQQSTPPTRHYSNYKKLKKDSSNYWFHGTSAATLIGITHSDFQLLPTGHLLNRRIIPYTGELDQGISFAGINFDYLSGTNFNNVKTAIHYAYTHQKVHIDKSEFCKIILNILHDLERNENHQDEDLDWYPLLFINCLKLRQIDEDFYFKQFHTRIQNQLKKISQSFDLYKSKINKIYRLLDLQINEPFESFDKIKMHLDTLSGHQIDKSIGKNTLLNDNQNWTKEKYKEIFLQPSKFWDQISATNFDEFNILSAIFLIKQLDRIFFETNKDNIQLFIENILHCIERYETVMQKAISEEPVPIHLSSENIDEILHLSDIPLVIEGYIDPVVPRRTSMMIGEIAIKTKLTLGKEIKTLYTPEYSIPRVKKFITDYQLNNDVQVLDLHKELLI